jgi:L-cysteine S-thiosulfotransferase
MRGRKKMKVRQSHFVLATIAGGVLGAVVLGIGSASAAPLDARKLVTAHCEQCHEVKGIQNFGNIGPSLIDLKARYPDRNEVAAIIFDETKRNPQTMMPPFGRNLIINKMEIDTIVDFLYAQ